jgi:hypothetical protein
MPVRVEKKGPIAVYLFRRKRDDCVTQEMPAIILPDDPQPSSPKNAGQDSGQLSEPL